MSIQLFNKSPTKGKVNFLDEHVDNVITENTALRSKLQSKVEALSIMSKQLNKCLVERDHYKLLTEQFQMRYPLSLKSNKQPEINFNNSDLPSNLSGAQLLANTREQNKLLIIEVESLKHKLEEAEKDMKALRKASSPNKLLDRSSLSDVNVLTSEREESVRQLELSNKKIEQMQTDLKSMLDEKEDLINERDAYKCKLHRLNHQLMVAMSTNKSNSIDKSKPGLTLDIDALVMENRYLQERLTQTQAEKELACHALTKYKSILETKQQKGALKLGTSNSNAVISHKQVKQLLESGTSEELPINAATIADLRALSSGLLDSLNDKSLALSHQKKANRILAARISDLEKHLENGTNMEERVAVFPSKVLLESYCSSEVDQFKIETEGAGKNAQKEDTVTSDETNDDISNIHDYENGEDCLPPELQKLVQEALNDLYLEQN